MKHYFILNPAAGQGKALELEKKIWQAADQEGTEPVIHITTAPGDGEEYVRRVCSERQGAGETELLRFYACGGDGTLSEVVNGAFGAVGVEVGNIPVGTGNDFIRNFDEAGDFSDITLQMRSGSSWCDLIHYEGICDGEAVSRYCVNMFNIGFDCNVVDKTAELKKKPLMSGALAYLAGVGIMLLRKEGAELKVEYEDGSEFSGGLLLIAVANGCYCGGGVKGIPKAVTDDGLMDVSLVTDTTRRNFVRLFPKYSKGTHLEDKRAQKIVSYRKCHRLVISPAGETMKLCVDGEITHAKRIEFEIVPRAFRFIQPGLPKTE